MPGCAALNCNNSTEKGFRVHDFPVNIDRRRLWADRSGRDFSAYENGLPTKNMKLCEAHFTADQYVPDARYGRKLKPNAVPTLFDGLMHREVQDNLEQHLHQDIEFDQESIDRAASGIPEENFQPECHVPEHALLADSLAEANRQLRRKDERIAELLREKHDLQRQVRTSRGREAVFDENLGSFLNKDQIQRLRIAGKGTGFPWTEATIKDAIQIRIMTGVKGYEYLRTCKGFPLPSYRTICRRLESCQFEAGLDNEIFSLLGSKLRGEEEINRHCWLSMDEMTIKNALEFDKGLKKYVGFITPDIAANEEEKGIVACKVFAFVVRGLSVKWKQTIVYFLVGASVDTAKLWECILCIIRKLHAEGLNVRGITMDMGSNNTALWSYLGIHAVRGSTQNTVDHPIIADQKLYISPDLAHLLKNLWTALTVQDIYLPPELSEEHPEWDGHLTVSIQHISKLIELQERPYDRGITLQHKLRRYHIRPVQRQKMRVKYAAQALSRSTAVALRFCADSELIPEIDSSALPTAWFIEQVNEWFDYMNDRKQGINGQYVGDRKIAILEDFSRLIASLSFQREGWKPVQRGIILATKNVVDLRSDLVTNGAFRYLLPGRLTSDCIENLFSQVRQSGSENPGPAEVRLGLRLITVSQFLHVPKGSNYEEDDDDYIVEFLRARGRVQPNPDPVDDEDFAIPEDLTELQCQGLYKLAGWIAKKVGTRACFYCQELAISEEPLDNCPSEWTTMLSRGGLTHPSLPLYRIVKTAEEMFNSLKETLLHANAPLSILKEQILLNIDPEILDEIQPQCEHDLLSVIINKFISFRVHVLADDRTRRIPNDIAYGGRVWHMANGARVRRWATFMSRSDSSTGDSSVVLTWYYLVTLLVLLVGLGKGWGERGR